MLGNHGTKAMGEWMDLEVETMAGKPHYSIHLVRFHFLAFLSVEQMGSLFCSFSFFWLLLWMGQEHSLLSNVANNGEKKKVSLDI